MGGSKIEMAKRGRRPCRQATERHRPLRRRCYDEEVATVMDRTHATKEAKQLALSGSPTIDARGSTDLQAAGNEVPN